MGIRPVNLCGRRLENAPIVNQAADSPSPDGVREAPIGRGGQEVRSPRQLPQIVHDHKYPQPHDPDKN